MGTKQTWFWREFEDKTDETIWGLWAMGYDWGLETWGGVIPFERGETKNLVRLTKSYSTSSGLNFKSSTPNVWLILANQISPPPAAPSK